MERNPTNTEDLWVKVQEGWSKISIEDCQELIHSEQGLIYYILQKELDKTLLKIIEK